MRVQVRRRCPRQFKTVLEVEGAAAVLAGKETAEFLMSFTVSLFRLASFFPNR